MSSEVVQKILEEDKTLQATYDRLRVLGDASQALIAIRGGTELMEMIQSVRSDLSKHNHRDLIPENDWRLVTTQILQSMKEKLIWFLPPNDKPCVSKLRLILSDMQESFERPVASR